MVPAFLKQQLVGAAGYAEASPVGFSWASVLRVGDGSWGNYSLKYDRHQSGETARWPHHSFASQHPIVSSSGGQRPIMTPSFFLKVQK